MHITEIELKDWGPHKHIHEHLSDPVVGLLGPNGSGKTNVLEAIEFAFTGLLKENQETYVRHFGEEFGANNASVRISFVKNGMHGNIFRQVGKSNKRKITWDNRTERSDKGCNALMAEIFEADREAVANAVFINQGSLDKMLFGKPSERYELFVKLILLGYLEKRSKLVESKYMALSNGLQDFSILADDLNRQESEINNTIAALEGETAQTINWSEDIKKWTAFKDCEADLLETAGQVSQLRADVSQTERSLKQSLSELGESITLDTLEESVEELQVRKDALNKELLAVQDMRRIMQEHASASEDVARCDKHLNETDESLKDVVGKIGDDSSSNKKKLLDLVKSHTAVESVLDSKSQEAHTLRDTLEKAEAVELPLTECEVEQLHKRLETLSAELAEARIRANLLAEASKSGFDSKDNCCPVCKSAVGEDLLSEDNVSKAHDEHMRKKSDADKISAEISEYNTAVKNKHTSVDNASKDLTKVTKEILAAIKEQKELDTRPSETAEELQERITTLEGLERRKIVLESELANADRNKRVAQSKLDAINPIDVEKSGQVSEEAEIALREEVDKITAKRDLHKTQVGNIKPVSDLLKNKRGALEHQQSLLVNLRSELTSAVDAIPARVLKIAEKHHKVILKDIKTEHVAESSKDEVLLVTQDLEDKQNAWNSLQGSLKQALQTKASITARRKEMEASMEADKNKRKLIDSLKTVKEMLGKNGIITEIINDRYARIIELTQDHLTRLDSSFMIEQDPDNPVSVRFWRVDDDSEYVMAQNKLSGGQRVRYTVAFLLAVQQLIIPEVGFLVLDEPSVHVDEPGVESIKELLLSLGDQLSSAESQVIVCDHNKALEPAFGETIRIK